MNIGEILQKAWEIVWKHKVLWVFGILASCVEGGGGGGNGGGGGGTGSENFDFEALGLPVGEWAGQFTRFFEGLETNPEQYIGLIAVILLLMCVLWLVAVALGTYGRIGLIRGALQADAGVESLSFGELWSDSQPYFWRVLGLWMVLWLTAFVLFAGLALLAAFGAVLTLGLAALCILPFICLFIPAMWLFGLLFEQATIAMVKEDLSISDALSRAWGLIRANLGNYVLMALSLFVIQFVIGIVLALPFFVIMFPVIFGTALGGGETIASSLLIFGLCFVVYIPVLIVLGGILRAYTWTSWTLTFTRLSENPVLAPADPAKLDAY